MAYCAQRWGFSEALCLVEVDTWWLSEAMCHIEVWWLNKAMFLIRIGAR